MGEKDRSSSNGYKGAGYPNWRSQSDIDAATLPDPRANPETDSSANPKIHPGSDPSSIRDVPTLALPNSSALTQRNDRQWTKIDHAHSSRCYCLIDRGLPGFEKIALECGKVVQKIGV